MVIDMQRIFLVVGFFSISGICGMDDLKGEREVRPSGSNTVGAPLPASHWFHGLDNTGFGSIGRVLLGVAATSRSQLEAITRNPVSTQFVTQKEFDQGLEDLLRSANGPGLSPEKNWSMRTLSAMQYAQGHPHLKISFRSLQEGMQYVRGEEKRVSDLKTFLQAELEEHEVLVHNLQQRHHRVGSLSGGNRVPLGGTVRTTTTTSEAGTTTTTSTITQLAAFSSQTPQHPINTATTTTTGVVGAITSRPLIQEVLDTTAGDHNRN